MRDEGPRGRAFSFISSMRPLSVALLVVCLVAAVLVEARRAKKRDVDPAGTPMIWELTDGEDKGIGAGFDIVDDLRQPPWVRLLSHACSVLVVSSSLRSA